MAVGFSLRECAQALGGEHKMETYEGGPYDDIPGG